ncbi:PQQ-binding-like beta-propeller repeat protein [Haloarchaeobius sp. HME9146]|uniref:outer membrane protein assembly factor BamB family protein n=1 Tax=Haloarchaeobius sp. HME9146 TaxID=2978732 RepID=UPI0021BF9F6A|nr:PQQ-binding-like beta-propeller repeat protein [Haloarchaeobius sp. HME9146]MCT9095744.1 PQQ-binding-like beta-propeller repeat protein [Haloarchaeobius sp. HME9146]
MASLLSTVSPRRVRIALTVVVCLLALSGVAATATYDPPELQRGTVTDPANGTTVVSAHGWHASLTGPGDPDKPVRLVGLGPDATLEWEYETTDVPGTRFYDVDPLPNGDLLVTNTTSDGQTSVYRLDPDTGERRWTETLDIQDTHDVDLINEDELLVANIKNSSNGTSYDGVFVYDRGEDRITWHWYFRNHYPLSTDSGLDHDWTHVNDVDKIGNGTFMVSPRDFDQVIAIDRETKNITWRLGSDDDYTVMNEQHNPQYLETESGQKTVLVADSENDRVVEYTYENGSWTKVWEVGDDQLQWPRDADRLPNGNTLIVDSMNHRVVEVTPQGEIVWEYFVPWAPYDAERMAYGDEPGGPTMRDQNVSGSYELSGSAGHAPHSGEPTVFQQAEFVTEDVPVLGDVVGWTVDKLQHYGPWAVPHWVPLSALFNGGLALVIGLGWAVGEAVIRRERIVSGFRGRLGS